MLDEREGAIPFTATDLSKIEETSIAVIALWLGRSLAGRLRIITG